MLPDIIVELDWRGKRYTDVLRGLAAVATDVEKDFEAITPIVKRILTDYMRGVVKSVADRVSTPYPSGTSRGGAFPGSLSKRSGKLLAGLNPSRIQVKGSAEKDVEVSFSLTGIANVHERGATITPKKAKYLTIPLPPALNANGTPKKPNARAWKNTFILKSKKGNLLIVRKIGKGGIEPLYVLKKSVKIPKRLAFEEAFQAGRSFLADEIANQVIKEFFNAR
jgi:hypothetical protein